MSTTAIEIMREADEEKRLPSIGEITAVRESAEALDVRYRRLKRTKLLGAVRGLLDEQDGGPGTRKNPILT